MSFGLSIADSVNSIVNQSTSAISSSGVIGAIKNAATKTGVDFSYLLKKASQESGLDPTAKASTSTATGLFQFTSQTWLQMVKNNGAQYGLGNYASQITADANGHLTVADPQTKQAILALRNDPTVSAEMAGELDKQNAASLQQNVGGKIGGTELYLAHFLGASGASDFISSMRSNPSASAASVMPDAAAANNSVFYDKTGNPRSLAQIYQHFAAKFDSSSPATSITGTTSTTATQVAGLSTPVSAATVSPMTAALSSAISATGTTVGGSTGSSAFSGSLASSATTTTGASTLFTAMVLGQMNGNGLDPNSTYNALTDSDAKKKNNALSVLSAVA